MRSLTVPYIYPAPVIVCVRRSLVIPRDRASVLVSVGQFFHGDQVNAQGVT